MMTTPILTRKPSRWLNPWQYVRDLEQAHREEKAAMEAKFAAEKAALLQPSGVVVELQQKVLELQRALDEYSPERFALLEKECAGLRIAKEAAHCAMLRLQGEVSQSSDAMAEAVAKASAMESETKRVHVLNIRLAQHISMLELNTTDPKRLREISEALVENIKAWKEQSRQQIAQLTNGGNQTPA